MPAEPAKNANVYIKSLDPAKPLCGLSFIIASAAAKRTGPGRDGKGRHQRPRLRPVACNKSAFPMAPNTCAAAIAAGIYPWPLPRIAHLRSSAHRCSPAQNHSPHLAARADPTRPIRRRLERADYKQLLRVRIITAQWRIRDPLTTAPPWPPLLVRQAISVALAILFLHPNATRRHSPQRPALAIVPASRPIQFGLRVASRRRRSLDASHWQFPVAPRVQPLAPQADCSWPPQVKSNGARSAAPI